MGIKDRDWYWDKHDELTGRKRRAPGLWRALTKRVAPRSSRSSKAPRAGFPAWLAWLLFAIVIIATLFVGLRGAFHTH